MTGPDRCPPGWAGLFGEAVARADAEGAPCWCVVAPGVRINILPEFAALPVPRVLSLLWTMARTMAGFDRITLSVTPCPQAGVVLARGAPGGDARQPPIRSADADRCVAPVAASPAAGVAPGNVLPFPGGRQR